MQPLPKKEMHAAHIARWPSPHAPLAAAAPVLRHLHFHLLIGVVVVDLDRVAGRLADRGALPRTQSRRQAQMRRAATLSGARGEGGGGSEGATGWTSTLQAS